jgi:hypothetical protein
MRIPVGARPRHCVPRPLDALGPVALGAVAAVALSACAVANAPGAASQPGKLTGATGTPSASARPAWPASLSPAAPTPKQRAEADAHTILASFAVPKGATQLSAAPAVDKGVLKQPIQMPGTPDLVDTSQWWIAPGAPQAVLAWEKAHVPRRFSADGTGSGYGPGYTVWSDMFSLPEIPAVLNSRELIVTVVPDGARTAIRVDAQVSWLPVRPAGEQIPAAAKAVTVSIDIGMNQGGKKPPSPVTITDPAKVQALAALINGLSLFPPGSYSCPADFGASIKLTFRAGPGTPALAVATVDLAGCGGVYLTIGGTSEPALAGPGSDVGPEVLKAAGLSWTLPTD